MSQCDTFLLFQALKYCEHLQMHINKESECMNTYRTAFESHLCADMKYSLVVKTCFGNSKTQALQLVPTRNSLKATGDLFKTLEDLEIQQTIFPNII